MPFCIADFRTDKKILKNIEKLGFECILMPPNKFVSQCCCGHPDISLCRISENEIIYAKGFDENFLKDLKSRGVILYEGRSLLSEKYPYDIKYNAAVIGNYLIHKTVYTDGTVKEKCADRKMSFLNVKQGYSRCSVAVVRRDLAITADDGIFKAVSAAGGINVLKIPPQKSIRLAGCDYGFIGGAGGSIDDKRYALTGDVKRLENGKEIKEFLEKNGVEVICLSDRELVDLGTLMFFTI